MTRRFRATNRRIVLWIAIILCSPLALGLALNSFESRGTIECWYLPNPQWALTFMPGLIGVTRVAPDESPLLWNTTSLIAWNSAWDSRPHHRGWFDAGSTPAVEWFFVPAWMPLSLYAAAVVWALRKTIRRLWHRLLRLFRPPRGHCRRCAYNLAGLSPQTPCPECGRVPRASPPSTTPSSH